MNNHFSVQLVINLHICVSKYISATLSTLTSITYSNSPIQKCLLCKITLNPLSMTLQCLPKSIVHILSCKQKQPKKCFIKGGFGVMQNNYFRCSLFMLSTLRKLLSLFIRGSQPPGRDTGNDFFVPQISGGSVLFPGTLNVV